MAALLRPSAISFSTVALTVGEVVDRISLALAAHEQRHDRSVDDELAGPHPSHGVDQLAGMADAILQEVPDAAGGAGHQLHRVVHLEVLGEQEHAGAGRLPRI